MLSIIEKVIFLQDVDIFKHISSEDLSYVASITVEQNVEKDSVIYKEGDISDSMYMVIDGKVRLHVGESLVMIAELNDVFGAWSLFDDEVRLISATAFEESLLLKIDKADMIELLADHVGVTEGILKAMAKRLQNIARKVGADFDKVQK
ncbi:MAG: cyclic nucleotide-binding domain-containing protein [Candidatus Marinimicrobia bacterium]|nr:cyclic nucleotide-binding domain-containing protein [Candidatus Neomarinimicrobiota bacterium]